ncbi:hypothetical protein NIES2101_00270 [Calothrix sp. HK-06]|nr:hypothetical protein NIES2101_00270 [Calothrix sp. HK-06]
MKDEEYIQRVAEMLYHYQVHRILTDNDSELFKKLSKLPESKRFRQVYEIFSNCSSAKSPPRILQIVKQQLGVCEIEDFDFLNDLSISGVFYWYKIRHEQYKQLGCGTYSICCLVTEHTYVGSSKNIPKRLAEHRCKLNSSAHWNAKLQALWLKYGKHSFYFRINKITTDYKNDEKMLIEEMKYQVPLVNCSGR